MAVDYPEVIILPTDAAKDGFAKFVERIPVLIKEIEYDEMWGHQLDPKGQCYEKDIANAILFKYFKANEYNVEESVTQLKESLKWRKDFKPLSAGFVEKHDRKFADIGFLTYNAKAPANCKVVTWNLYGVTNERIKNPKEYFSDTDEFVRWRIGLMEQAIGLVDFTDKTNNFIAQVHDYGNVAFLLSDKSVKSAGKKVVRIFQQHYPEFLSCKYFLNFPVILSWIYNFIVKNWFISEATVKKFHIMHNGKNLAKEFKVDGLPKAYGGNGLDLENQRYDVNKIKLSAYGELLAQEEFKESADLDID